MTDPLWILFGSAARVKLLRLFLFNPRQHFNALEAAARSQVEVKLARKELKLFSLSGLLKRPRSPRGRYALRDDFRYILALQSLLLNSPARGEDLYERFRPVGSLKLIVAAGIFVGEWEEGRLDLLIVGDRVNERALRRKVKALESELGKELRYAFLTTQEFSYRLNMSDKLVRDVMDYSHTIVFDRLNIGLK